MNSTQDELKKLMPRHIIVIHLKLKKKKSESSEREIKPYLYRKNRSNDSRFLIQNHRGQKEVT